MISHGTEMPVYALAVYEVHGPGSKEFPEKMQYALAVLKGRLKGKQYEWWVDDVRFPYTPKSYVRAGRSARRRSWPRALTGTTTDRHVEMHA